MLQIKNFISGEYRSSDTWFPKRSPCHGREIAKVALAGRGEVEDAVDAAHRALRGPWGKMSSEERAALLHKVADEITRRSEDFVQAESSDIGQPEHFIRHVDVPRGAANFRVFADIVRNVGGEFFEMATADGRGALNYSVRRPVGVVAVICPWNLPFLLMTWKLGPALACGNTVVVKPSEETPQSAALLGEVMNAVGLPPGVFNVVHGFGPGNTGEYLTTHSKVSAITFTGETQTGAAIMKAASTGARPVSLEMGGKNAAIIFADCDIDAAIEGTMRSAFANCGQVCLATERVFVERSIFVEFVSRLKAAVEQLRPGFPSDPLSSIGPLISDEHRQKVLSFYRSAVEDGATVVIGGGIPEVRDELAGGWWIEPTIWTGLADSSRVQTNEIFGPCCHISAFDSEEEVIGRVNDSEYGLACSIWTSHFTRAHRVSAAMEVGIVWINSWFLRDLRTPFGGAKHSGIGREGGHHSLEFYTELKNVCVKL